MECASDALLSCTFYPSAQIGLEGYCRHPAGGRAGVATSPLPLSRAQLLSDRGQTW